MAKKYMYMNLYTNIFMQMWSGWINTTTSHHPNHWITWRSQWAAENCGTCSLTRGRVQGRGSPNGRDYKHACANHLLDTFQATVFTPNIYSWTPLTPRSPPLFNTLLSRTLVSAFAIWSVFISIITQSQGRRIIGYNWIKQTNIFVWL